MKNKKSSQTGVQHVVTLDPKTVHPPVVSTRHASAFCGAEFDELKQGMQSVGKNVQPILVRPRVDAPGHYDLIFGERRHRAALECKDSVELRAIVDDSLDDVAAFFSVVQENAGKKALSPLELGQQILYGIERKIFKNQEDAGKKLNKNKSLISRSVAVASLPAELISAFPNADDLQYRFAKSLADAVKLAPDSVKAEALKIKESGEVLTAIEVKRRLLRAAGENVAPLNKRVPVILEIAGQKLAQISFDKAGKIHVQVDFSLDEIQESALSRLLTRFYLKNISKSNMAAAKSKGRTLKQEMKLAEKINAQLAAYDLDQKKELARAKRLAKAREKILG